MGGPSTTPSRTTTASGVEDLAQLALQLEEHQRHRGVPIRRQPSEGAKERACRPRGRSDAGTSRCPTAPMSPSRWRVGARRTPRRDRRCRCSRCRGTPRGDCPSRPPRYRPSRRGVPPRALVGPGRRGGQRVLNIHPAALATAARVGELPVAAIGAVARPPGAADQHGIDRVGIALAIHGERGVLETHLRRDRQSIQRPARAAIARDRVLPGGRHRVDLVVSAHAEVGSRCPARHRGSRVAHPLEAPGAAAEDKAAVQRGAPSVPGHVHRARAGLDGQERVGGGAARLADRRHLGLEGEAPGGAVLGGAGDRRHGPRVARPGRAGYPATPCGSCQRRPGRSWPSGSARARCTCA